MYDMCYTGIYTDDKKNEEIYKSDVSWIYFENAQQINKKYTRVFPNQNWI